MFSWLKGKRQFVCQPWGNAKLVGFSCLWFLWEIRCCDFGLGLGVLQLKQSQKELLTLDSVSPGVWHWKVTLSLVFGFFISQRSFLTLTLATQWFSKCVSWSFVELFRKGEDKGLSSSTSPSWRRKWHPTSVLLPGKSHGRRSLVGCSPWGREESDMTERLHFHFSLLCIGEGNGNPLQCSCIENPKDGVAQSRTRLKRLSSSSSSTSPSGSRNPQLSVSRIRFWCKFYLLDFCFCFRLPW